MVIKFMNSIWKKTLTSLNLALLVGCVSNPQPIVLSDEMVSCTHRYDPERTFVFYRDRVNRFIINDVITFHIITLDQTNIFLNIYEIENYNCTEYESFD